MTHTRRIRYFGQDLRPSRSGFTLIELLVVLAIIVALFAILAPNIFLYQQRANERQAKSQLRLLQRALDDYSTEFGRYPATEQGLKALIYIPANEMTGMQTGLTPMQGMQGGAMTGDPNSMMGGAGAVGGMAQQPGMMGGMDQTGMGMQGGMMGGMDQTGGAGAIGGMAQQPGMMGGMDQTGMGMQQGIMGGMDQTGAAGTVGGMGQQPGMMGGMSGGMDSTGAMAGGMQGTGFGVGMSNPNLFVNPRKRPNPFLDGDDVPLDPWKNPYRYDNSITATGVNPFTGERNKPAIWSAGKDGIDGNEDDIRSWDPLVAQQQLMHSQQGGMNQGMQQQGMMGGMDQTGMGMQQQGMMGGMDQTGMGMQQQGMMGGMDQTGMGMQQQGMQGGMDQGGGMMPPAGGMGGGMMPPAGGMGGGMTPPAGGMGGGMTPPGGGMMPPNP